MKLFSFFAGCIFISLSFFFLSQFSYAQLLREPSDVTAGGSISGMKFYDENGNGVRDIATDYGLPNWKIKISGSKTDSVYTDANGNYIFDNLSDGTYIVSEEKQVGWLQTTPPSPGTYTVIIVSGTPVGGKNFGNYPLVNIKGKKFNDLNGNGIFDSGEPGLQGWVIKLTGAMAKTDTTDVNGNYDFIGLIQGTYVVRESLSLKPGWQQTFPDTGYYSIETKIGDRITRNFGNFQKVSIGGQKFHDLDGDGTKDAGELGLAGWKIRIAGSKNDSATTDVNGSYVFADLGPGSYTLSEDMQTGWMQTVAPTGTIVTSSGTNVVNKDFGNFQRVSISGQKFHDKNGDGIKDTGEEGLSNWKIKIAGAKVDSILTDANGNYTFPDLGPGSYTLSEVAQSGWIQTSPAIGTIVTSSGTNVIDKDFGNYQMATVSGMKFNDMDGDGIKDTEDLGLNGWKIKITGTKTDSAITDANGNYTISNLPKGSYTLTEILQSGWKQTYPTGNSYSITVDASGTIITDKDFGNFKLATISGMKFNDLNGDSLKSTGELGLSGWKIRITGAKIDSVLTDANGNYTFANLDTGNYVISEEVQNGWIQTYPIGSTYSIRIDVSSTIITSQNFGNFQLASISGKKYTDLVGDSSITGDATLNNWKIKLFKSGVLQSSVLTSGSGDYAFNNLLPGIYTVEESLQTDWMQTYPRVSGAGVVLTTYGTNAGPRAYQITVTSGGNFNTRDFGNFHKVSIGGQKFHDLDGDGTKDAGELGLAGWKIRIAGSKNDSATTDVNGNYVFADLEPGSYTLSEDMQTGWMQTVAPTGTIVTSSGTNVVNKDFGNFQKVSISGQKYHDRDGDGIKDTGEEALANWKIRIAGAKVDSIFTDVNGNYTFINLGPGCYTLSEVAQSGWIQTSPANGLICVSSGTNVIDKDFGNYQMAIVSGMKFNDMNGDSIKNTGDIGLSGWKIRITGTKTDSATTDINGNYTISNLPKGNYTLTEVLQSGWKQTYPAGNSYSITVDASGTVITGKDFGNFKLATISGKKYNDTAGDSALTGDIGLNNWVIKLYKSGVYQMQTTTGLQGDYTFNNIDAGSYTIEENLNTGWVQTYPRVGSAGVVLTTYGGMAGPRAYAVNVNTSGTIITGKDFANFQLGSISGTKFNDLNGNGVKDAGDPHLSVWNIRLNGAKVDSVITDANGNYTFTNLGPGNYTLSEELQTGWIQTLGQPGVITMTSGATITSKNFGNFQVASISGKKYNDAVGDSLITSDVTLNNWVIKLYKSGVFQSSTITSGSGDYTFNNLIPGTYTVEESLETNWMQTYPRVGSAGVVLTTYGTNAGKRAYQVSVSSGTNSGNKDFGNFQRVSISGQKFHDRNGDGIKDAGEEGLSNWKIKIGGAKVDSIFTDVNGNYSFSNLGPGSYTLSEVLQNGWVQMTLPIAPIVVSSGTNVIDKDFGNYQMAIVSGMKFNDLNGYGVKEIEDLGLSGWKIRITGTKTDSATTDINGNYTISNLPKGSYTLTEVLQSGWKQTSPAGNSYSITVDASGTVITGKDFGNFKLATISGMKFNDLNGDSIKNTGELGLSGWKIRLTGAKIDSVLTDANGNYTFANLDTGNYVISEEVQNGWIQTYPIGSTYSIRIDVSSTIITSQNFGNFRYGSISGTKFNDLNGNSVKDAGDTILSGWKIRLNGAKIDSVLTDGSGNYTFSNLGPGNYTLNEELQTGWIQTLGQPGVITMTSGAAVTGKNFGNFQKVSISGQKFHDLDGDGVKDAEDIGLIDWTIRLSGTATASTTTDANGNYTFSDLGPGSYTLSEDMQTGWMQTKAPTGSIVTSSGTNVVNKDFGNFQLASISGKKYTDMAADSSIAGDNTLNNWVIKLYKSGVLQSRILTGEFGDYSFNNLTPGTYTVEESLETSWMQTYPQLSTPGVVLTTFGTNAGKRAYQVTVSSGINSNYRDFGNYQMATISGMKFNDLNGDSVKDAGDIGLSGWKIKITGTKTDSATTDANGNYTISNLPKGSYTLTEILQTGWKQTYPSGNSYNVTVGASGTVITGKDFGNFKLGIISGMKFNDLDGDGLKEAGESGLSGWIMWITGTKNDSVITDAGGNYSFNNLDIGNYTVTEEIKPGWLLTYPPGASYNIAIDASGINASGKDFGNFQLPTISGKKFHDHNGNGIKDPEDEGLIGWKIYLSGPRIDSAITDSYGDYTFVGLTPGKYLVRESIQDGWVQTTPNPDSITVTSNGSVTGINFGNFQKINISGRKFHDLNGNGVKDSGEPGLTGWGIKLGGAKTDSKTSDVNGDFIFTDLGPGKYAVTEQIQLGWVQTLHVDSFTVRSGENVLGKDIGNFQTISISGKKFHDFNGNGIIDGADTTVSGWHIQLTGSNRHDTVITNALGEYSFNNVGPGSFTISEEEKPGWLQAFPSGAGVYNLNVNASGQNISDKNFGNIFVGGLSGRKFQDKNGNGIEELDEPGLEGWVIVLNGPVGTRKDTTNSMGYYSFTNLPVGAYTISEEEQTGWIQTKPPQTSPEYHINLISGQHIDTLNFGNFSQGIVEGYKFNDTDGDGIKETGDSLMAGWNISLLRDGNVIGSTVTDVNGKYKFTGVAAGLYSVGEESKNGWIQLFPPTGLHRDTMIVGGYHPNKNFGNFETGTLRGQKFKDINGNHTRDAGEPVLQNWWIKISGPKTDSVLTDVNGSYSFTNLGPGTYTLTEKLQIGWMQTYPVSGSHIVTMTSGKIVTGLDFGNFERSSISGIKYFDKNANGTLDQSDTRLANFRIYLRGDNPANNAETLTDAQGNYTFPSLAVDSFTVYEESKQGWVTIAPTSGYYRVFLQSGEQRTNLNFGNYTDTVMYRTFSQTHFTEKPLRLKRRGPVPMPTGGNFCDATAKASTWAGGGFILGVASPESSKTNGWIRIHPNHVRAIFSYLTRRYFPVTGTAAGFDILNGRVYRSNHSISAIKNQNNHLAAEQLVLKFNIAASDLNITPKGFGNLIYYDSLNPGNPCQNKTLYRIREFTDSALTFWRQYSGTPGFFNQLDTCISRINRAFLGTIDTISTNPLRFTGVRSISGIGYLKPNPFPSVSDPAPIVEIDNGLPVEYALYQNYPNPFNPSTTIEFELPIPGRVTLKIYNVLGQEVAQLFNNEDMDEGRMQIAFDASLLASGVYFYRLTVENIDEEEIRNSTFVDTKKMILVK